MSVMRRVAIDHLTLPVTDLERSRAFYAAAPGAGGRDDGAPGERAQYHAGYHGAHLADPDGHDVEAVFHDRSHDSDAPGD